MGPWSTPENPAPIQSQPHGLCASKQLSNQLKFLTAVAVVSILRLISNGPDKKYDQIQAYVIETIFTWFFSLISEQIP